jgi:hypothetical protein
MAKISEAERIQLAERIQTTADFYSWKNLTRNYMDVFGI